MGYGVTLRRCFGRWARPTALVATLLSILGAGATAHADPLEVMKIELERSQAAETTASPGNADEPASALDAEAAPASTSGRPDEPEAAGAPANRADDDGADVIVRVLGETGEPVRGAAVWIRSGERWVERQSDATGTAEFVNLPAGAARIQVVATGWNSSGDRVDVDGADVSVEIALERRSAPGTVSRAADLAERTSEPD